MFDIATNVGSTAVLLAAFAVLPACSKTPQAKTPAALHSQGQSFAEQHPGVPQEAPTSPSMTAVHISEDIVRACGISAPDAYFAFDSARLTGSDLRVLDQVASCFDSGPLKGRKMSLVGRADPRGTEDYNMTLGQSRADSVGNYLQTKGVSKDQVHGTTRGAMDATGVDEPSWARDRRVDVSLSSN